MKKSTSKTSKPTFKEENNLWEKGYTYIIGVDEVGRGAFAGPVVTGAVVFKKNIDGNLIEHLGIHDSKLLSPQKRAKLDNEIRLHAEYFSISEVGVSVINKIGIGKATKRAFRNVIADIISKILNIENLTNENSLKIENWDLKISKRKNFVLVDGFHIKYIRGIGLKNQKAIIKGDQKIISISAASIIAKVYRDNLMKNLSNKYPQYHFSQNKGYGTKDHQLAIKRHGLSKLHRKSFKLEKFY